MRSPARTYSRTRLFLAVQAALAAFAAAPALAANTVDEDLQDLTVPVSSMEVGGLYVDDSSAKFGEYNGLNKQGWYIIGNVRMFGTPDPESAFRWRIVGDNLGLDSRYILGEWGEQGSWRVTATYDQIVRNYSDQYQTMYQGVGSTTLTLPSGYPAASTRLSVTNNPGGILANWNNIQSPNATASSTGGGPAFVIPANMHQADIGTERRIEGLNVSRIFAPGWEARLSVRHEDKDGTKLTGVNIGRFSGVSALMPEPIDSSTDQFEAAVAYAGKQGNFQLGYYGSFYRNNVKLWTVENPGSNNIVYNNVARLQSYPDNDMHQLNFQGGWRFTPATRFMMSGAYSRMTQNDPFIDNPAGSNWVVPETSAHAKVEQWNLLARLTSQVAKDFNVLAAYRYDDRDNKTPIAAFQTLGGDQPGATSLFSNEPINRKLQQLNLEGDYRIGRNQSIRGEYEWQEIKRTSDAEESPFRADRTRENTGRISYRNAFSEFVSGRISYAYSQRRVSEYEEGNPRPTNPPAPFPAADPLLGGFEQFFLADRDRHKLRTQLNYEPAEKVSLQATLDLNKDRYPNLTYGLKKSESWVAGLDGTYAATDALAFTAFYTYEDMNMQLDSLAIARGTTATTLVPHVSGPPCAAYTNVANTLPADYYTDPCRNWSESQKDKVHTLGVGARYNGLMAGRLTLTGELAYSKATTPISVTGGTYYNNGVPNSPTGNVFIPAESFPDIKTEFTQIRLNGFYVLDKQSSWRVVYIYGRLKSSDWAYDAYAQSVLGVLAVQNYIGPGMSAYNYNVNAVGVSYTYRFR